MRSLSLLPAPLLALIASALPHETTTSPSGLEIEYTTPATCSRPTKSGDKISVHYRGTLQSDGTVFDESYKRGSPFSFVLGAGQVIKGWDEGLLDMCPGEERLLTIPSELAYGDRGAGRVIKGGATLVFETRLVDIIGVKQESISFETVSASATPTAEGAFSIATAPATPPSEESGKDEVQEGKEHEDSDQEGSVEDALTATLLDPETEDKVVPEVTEQGECHLLGPFALLVQGALGAFAILSLVWKRYRETPKRPWKIWFFDVSKQVFGSMLTHVLNLAMSMLSSVEMVNAAKKVATEGAKGDPEGRMPNPCSFYLLNLGIDTTLGIPVLYILLKILHALFLHTPLAKPPESIKSGNYDQPPRATWWAKQLMIYFIGLTGMKLFVFFLFAAMPWLPWIGDWALRWTKGNEALEVTFAMFIFPLGMNAIQYWVIDNFIMDKKKDSKQGYEAVHGDDDEADGRGSVEHGSVTEVGNDEDAALMGKGQVEDAPLKEVNPTPIDAERGEASRTGTPVNEVENERRR